MKKKIFILPVFITLLIGVLTLTECRHETCGDLIVNQGETGIDCGGPCEVCPTCDDGIKNQGETKVDCGGPCLACPSCNDGILNQNETSIDCGGVCGPCIICVGDGTSDVFPLAKNNVWLYNNINPALDLGMKIEISSEMTFGNNLYFVVEYTIASYTSSSKYLRQDNAGDIYQYIGSAATEMKYIPKYPVPGDTVAIYGPGNFRKVDVINDVVQTPTCTYSDCIKIDDYENDTIKTSSYYVKGIGLVKQVSPTSVSVHLNNVTLY